MRTTLAVALLAALLLLPGCISTCEAPPPVSARNVPVDAPASGGSGRAAFLLSVREESPTGRPLPGAGVVFFWGDETGRSDALVQVGPDGVMVGGGFVDVRSDVRQTATTHTLELRTDGDGQVVADLPAGTIAGVVVAAPGYTEETVRAFATGSAGAHVLTVPLFHDSLAFAVNGDLGAPGAASTSVVPGVGTVLWYPNHDLLKPGYLERIVGLHLWLNWTNTPTGFGDLGLGLGDTTDRLDRYEDTRNEALPGAYTQELALTRGELDKLDLIGAGHLYAGPASSTGYLAPFGLSYALALTASFEARCGVDFDSHNEVRASPMPVAALAAAGLLAAAATRRR
jgi:hypothetical protein